MSQTTVDRVLDALRPHRLKDEGNGQYRADTPWRTNSNSHALRLALKPDGEHGMWYDHVAAEGGSLYDLAARLGVTTSHTTNGVASASKRVYRDLADYASEKGVPAAVFAAAGWRDDTWKGQRALVFTTQTGERARLITGTTAYASPAKYKACWYRLGTAYGLAQRTNQPLVLCNGEASVVVAQHWGVAATAITGSGERELPQSLLDELLMLSPPTLTQSIYVALDCDAKGQSAATKLVAQLTAAGYAAQAIDLQGSDGFDLADFCHLHGSDSATQLASRVSATSPALGAAPAAPQAPITRSRAILNTLTQLGYTFRLNLCNDTIEVNGQPITDVIAARIRTELRDHNTSTIKEAEDVYFTEAANNAYHPVKDYLNGLVWDGIDRIGQLATCCPGTSAPIRRADGTAEALIAVYLRRWLVGAVAKALAGEQNVMLVLAGAQGIGKSALARWLCRGLPSYFTEAPIRIDDKDADVRLMSHFIWEISELDATTRKADVSALKAFVTRQTVTVRKAYGRHDTTKPALASMIGTVNEGKGFLSDETGNRRFLVVNISRIDWSYTQLDVNQIWAQAVALYHAGEPWQLRPEEYHHQQETNKAYVVPSLLDDWITRWFDLHADDTCYLKAADIVDHLHAHDVQLMGNPTALAMQISQVLTRLGVSRGKGRKRDWWHRIALRETPNNAIPPDDGEHLHDGEDLQQQVLTEDTAAQSPGEYCEDCEDLLSIDKTEKQEVPGTLESHNTHGKMDLTPLTSAQVLTSVWQLVPHGATLPTGSESKLENGQLYACLKPHPVRTIPPQGSALRNLSTTSRLQKIDDDLAAIAQRDHQEDDS